MIRLHEVTRRYGAKTAVDRLDLHLKRGQVFAFLGPNGAGKTTTIKMMVGLLRPTAGRIELDGIDVHRHAQKANLLVGYVPDQPFLYDKLSGREFLQFVADMYNLSPAESTRRIERQIELFSLAEFVDHLCESYSHGMKQRVVFASAMLHQPPVLIVDEPMVGLDPQSMRLVKDLLRSHATEGGTVFMSTHTLSVAEEIADVIGIIHAGQLEFLGTVAELRRELALEHSTLEHLYLTLTSNGKSGNGKPRQPVEAESTAAPDDAEAG